MSVHVLIVVMIFLTIFGVGACSERPFSKPNVILISIDTLRADHLGCYGYRRETSPFIDKLAQEGTLFREAIAPSPWTLPSHASLLTGVYPKRHGVKDKRRRIPPQVMLLAEHFKSTGFATAGFVNSIYLSTRYGFGRGFEKYKYIPEALSAEFVIEEALGYLREKKRKKFSLFLHFYDVHSDYSPGQVYKKIFNGTKRGRVPGTTAALLEFRRGEVEITPSDMKYIIGLYDAEIREFSDKLETFFKSLKKTGVLENTLVIVTADHGEEFLDHQGVLHGRTLYDELIRVPLIFWGPGIPKGRVIQEQVELIDVMPTLFEWFGLASKAKLDGRSLAPLLEGREKSDANRAAFSEADHNNVKNDIKRMIRIDGYKLYFDRLTGRKEMYHLASDPGEKENIYDPADPKAIDLEKRLFEWMEQDQVITPEVPLSEKDVEHLKSLGYVN